MPPALPVTAGGPIAAAPTPTPAPPPGTISFDQLLPLLTQTVSLLQQAVSLLATQLGGGGGAVPATAGGGCAGAPTAAVQAATGVSNIADAAPAAPAAAPSAPVTGGGPVASDPPAAPPQEPAAPATSASPPRPAAQNRGGFTPKSVHMTQFRSKYSPDGPSRSPDCGIVSTVMALRLAGLEVPGHNGEKSYSVIRDARKIATGTSTPRATNDKEFARLVAAAGGKTTYTHDVAKIEAWAKAGTPVVLNGNEARSWGARYSNSQVADFDGSHAVTLSGFNEATGRYVINDPLSRIGVIEVTEAELRQFLSENGGGGLRVTAK